MRTANTMVSTRRLTLRRTPKSARLLASLTSLTMTLFAAGLPALPQTVEAADRIRYFHSDHLGSTNVVTDENGQVIERVQYRPFGEVYQREIRNPATGQMIAVNEGARISPFGYTGQRHDTTGLYFYGGRYYDPQLGRFISPDPFVQAPADPQTLNRYTYVRNNPVNNVDPSGHVFWFVPMLIGALIGGLLGGVMASINGQSFSRGFLAGAVGGAILGGYGAIAGTMFSGSTVSAIVARTMTMGMAGALAGTASAGVSGGDLGKGAAFGALGAAAFTAVGALPFPNNIWGAAADIGLSAAAGGGISKLAGGEFWQGAAVAGTLASGRQLYRSTLRWTGQKVADPSLRTSDGTWQAKKPGQATHGTGSPTSDVGVALRTDQSHNWFERTLAGEESLPMRFLSRIVPGLDPTAEFHDPFVGKLNGFMPGFTKVLYNQGTIPLSYGLTAAGALYDRAIAGASLGTPHDDN